MADRDDFSVSTKRALAERVSYHCSFPGCWAITIGPSEEASESRSSVGMACHIVAAAGGPGARRIVPAMSSEQRRSINNGIWLCYKHGKLIDTDETRFTIPMLKKWRRIAETRAQLELELGHPIDVSPGRWSNETLVEHSITLREIGAENKVIGDALRDCCLPVLWGRDLGQVVRDFAIEIARNAFQHGGATQFSLHFDRRQLRLVDDGIHFDSTTLTDRSEASGGAAALRYLVDNYSDRLIIESRRINDFNETVLSFLMEIKDVLGATECAIEYAKTDNHLIGLDIHMLATCRTIYVILPDYLSVSDVEMTVIRLMNKIGRKALVFVANDVSKHVLGRLLRNFKNARSLVLSADRQG